MVGQALHILVGYDAHPAGMQLAFWLATVALLVTGMRLMAMRLASMKARAAVGTSSPRAA